MKHETKRVPFFPIKVDDALGQVTAVVSVIGNLDDGGDVILPGAFTKTIKERGTPPNMKMRVLDQHRTDSILRVIGRPLEVREVGRDELPEALLADYPDAQGGLLTTTQFLMDTPEGKGAFIRIRDGAVDEYSIGYDPLNVRYEDRNVGGRKLRVRLLPEIKLYEYSPVIWGMNSATSTVGVKAMGGSELESPTLGDVLYGAVVPAFNRRADSLLERGLVTAEEHGTLLDAGREVAKGIKGAVPSDIHDRRTDSPVSSPAYYYMAGDDPDEEKATWDAAYRNSLPDSAFAYVAPDGTRYFPHHDKSGKPDAAHVRNALARIPQSDVPASAKAKALSHVESHARSLGIGEDSGKAARTETPPGTIVVGPSGSDHPKEPTPTGPGEGAGEPDEDLLLQVEIGLSEIAL
jgi:HK97 family phage prohead protease